MYSGFLAEIIDGEPRIVDSNKISDIRYFPLNRLPENVAPYTLQYLERI